MLQVFELIDEIAPTSRAVVLDTFSRSSRMKALTLGPLGRYVLKVCVYWTASHERHDSSIQDVAAIADKSTIYGLAALEWLPLKGGHHSLVFVHLGPFT